MPDTPSSADKLHGATKTLLVTLKLIAGIDTPSDQLIAFQVLLQTIQELRKGGYDSSEFAVIETAIATARRDAFAGEIGSTLCQAAAEGIDPEALISRFLPTARAGSAVSKL